MPTLSDLRDTYTVEVALDDKVSDRATQVASKLDDLSDAAGRAVDAHEGLSAASKAAAAAHAELNAVIADWGTKAAQVPQQMERVSAATDKITGAAGDAAQAVKELHASLTQRVGDAVTQSLGEAGRAVGGFGDSMDKLSVSVSPRGRTGSIFGGLKDMFTDTAATVTELYHTLITLGRHTDDTGESAKKLGGTYGNLAGYVQQFDSAMDTVKTSTAAVNEETGQAEQKTKSWSERAAQAIPIIGSLAVAVAGMGEEYRRHQQQLDALGSSLSGVRDDYAAVVQEIEAAGRAVHNMGPLSVSAATDAAKTIAKAPNFDPSLGLTDLTQTAEKLAAATGTSIQSSAQKIASALADTAAAAKTANNEGLKGFDDSLVSTIELLQKSGDRAQAFALYIDAIKKSSADAKEAMTPLQQAWRDLTAQFDPNNNPIGRWAASWIDFFENKLAGAIETAAGKVKEFNEWLSRKFPQIFGANGQPIPNAASYGTPGTLLTGTTNDATISSSNLALVDNAIKALADKIPEALRQGFEGFTTRVLQTESSGNMLDPRTGQILTSPKGNIGLMQLGPAVIHDYAGAANITNPNGRAPNEMELFMGKVPMQSETTPQGNVNIGASYILSLYNKYDHDIVKTAIAYNWGPKFADEFFAGTRNTLPSETVGFVQKTTSVTYDQLMQQFPQLKQGAFNQQLYRDANAMPFPDSIAKQRVDALAEIEKAEKALAEARKDADNAIANDDAEAFGKATRQIAEYHLKLDAATASYHSIRSASQQAADDQAAAADKAGKHLDGLGQKLDDYEKKIRDLATKSGQPVDEESLARGLQAIRDTDAAEQIDKQNKLVEAFEKQTDAMDAANKKAIEFAATQDKGGKVTQQTSDYVKVYTDLTREGIEPGDKFNEMLARRVKVMDETKQVQFDAGARQDVKDFDAQNQLLQDQTALLGQSAKVQAELVAEMQERHKWNKSLSDDLTEDQQKAVDAAKANADLKTSFQEQKQVLQELGQMVSSVFDSVANSITDAFIKGKGAAIDFGSIVKGVATQVAKDFLQLAILNPIANTFNFSGQTKPTISTVFDALSNLGGSTAGTSSAISSEIGNAPVGGVIGGINRGGGVAGVSQNGTGINSATSSGSGLLNIGSNLWSAGKSIYGFFSNGGSTSVATNSLVSSASNFLPGFGATSPFYGGAASESAMVTADSLAGAYETGATGAGMAGSLSGSAGTTGAGTIGGLSSALPVVGGAAAGFAAGSMVGGAVQGALGKTGPAPMVGAAVGAVGGAILGQILIPIPGLGALIGGVVGGVLGGGGGGLIGPKVASPYSSLTVNADQGMLHAGQFLSQKDPNAAQELQADAQQIQGLNDLMAKYNVSIAQQKSAMIQFGMNTPGKFVDPTKFQDLNTANITGKTALQQFGFTASDPILAQKLGSRDFATTQDLQTYLQAFTATQAAFTTGMANVSAALKELGAVTGSVNDRIKQLNDTYAANKANAETLINSGFLSDDQVSQMVKAEGDLADARDKAVLAAEQAAQSQLDQANQGLMVRKLQTQALASGSPGDALGVQLVSFDIQAEQQRKQFSDQMIGLYGDAFKTSETYANEMKDLEDTLGQERVAIVTAYNQKIDQQYQAQALANQGLTGRYLVANAAISQSPWDALQAQLYNFDVSAQQQVATFSQQLIGWWGKAYATTETYAGEMALLEKTLGAERVQIVQQYNQQILAAQAQLQQNDRSEQVRYLQAHATVTGNPQDALTAQLQAFDDSAQQQRVALDKQIVSIYGDTIRSTAGYAAEMALLEKTLGEERLAIVTQSNKQIAGAQGQGADAQAKAALAAADQNERVRYLQAHAQITGNPQDSQKAQLASFDLNAQQQRDALDKQLVDIYGAAVRGNAGYAKEMAWLERTLGEERLAIVHQYAQQLAEAEAQIAQNNQNLAVRYAQARATISGNPQDSLSAQLMGFDVSAQQQRDALDKQLVAVYGDTARNSANYASDMALLEKTLGAERLAIQKQAAAAIAQAQKQEADARVQTALAGVTNLASYASKLAIGNQSPLSPQSQYDLASSQFGTQFGKAKGGDFTAYQNITSYADTLLSASSAMFGTGTQYVQDFKRVLDAVNSLASMTPDQLTAAVYRSETRSQTQQLVDALAQIKSQVAALRTQIAQGSAAPLRLAA